MRANVARLAAASAGILAALLAAGCTSAPAASGGRIDGATRGGDTGSAPAPLSRSDRDFLRTAEEELIGSCMRARGFQYTAVPPPAVRPRREFPYGNEDVAWARRHGFGTFDGPDQEIDAYDPNQHYVERLPAGQRAAYGRALTGDLDRQVSVRLPDGSEVFMTLGGCTAEVSEALYGDPAVRLRLEHTVQLIRSEAYDRVVADPRYLAALTAWRGCMRTRGYGYDRPAAARAAVVEAAAAGPTTALRALESRTALADAECGRRSRLVATANRLDREHLTVLTRQFRAEAVAWQELQAAAVPRARQLTGSSAELPATEGRPGE